MKTLSLIVLVLLVFPVYAQEKIDRITIPLSRPGERVEVSLNQINGDISVEAYDGAEVIIDANFGGMNRRNHRHEDCEGCDVDVDVRVNVDRGSSSGRKIPAGMKRINSNPVELRATEDDNYVEIETESWKRKINVELKVPSNCNLDLNTVHGRITITGIDGELEISSVNGGIKASNISGSLVSNTVNGDIEVTFKSTNDNLMSFVTLNGDVDILLPKNTKATAKMKSDRGEIYSDFDMTIEKSRPEIRKDDGEYEVTVNSWVYGKMNGGGAEYTFKNMNGNIIIRQGD